MTIGMPTPEAFSRHMQKIDFRPQSSCLPSLHICVTPSHSENLASPQYYYIYLLICLVPLYIKTIFRIAIPHHYQLNEVQFFLQFYLLVYTPKVYSQRAVFTNNLGLLFLPVGNLLYSLVHLFTSICIQFQVSPPIFVDLILFFKYQNIHVSKSKLPKKVRLE